MPLRHLLLPCLLALSTSLHAQLPIIDYSFLAVPPSVLVNKVVEQPDGKILVGGFFLNYAGSGKNHLVRLNSDGSVDATWNPGGVGPQNQVRDIALMPDGRILVAGAFVEYNGVQTQAIVRLFANGNRDFSFNIPPNSINGAVNAIAWHREDKVIAVGDFFTCYGHSMPHIARFNTDGSVDLGFDIGTGLNNNAHCVLVLPDDRILVGGVFGAYNGFLTGNLALLSPNGPYDPSMNNTPGFGGGIVNALVRQPDGKILVGGEFQYHNMQPASCLIRLDLAGVRDATFTSPIYPYARVQTIALQADGMILIGGEYTSGMYSPNVPGPNRMTRIQPNGIRDDSFPLGEGPGPGTEATAYVSDIAVQADGRILVGGYFGNFDSETQYRNLIRLHPDAVTAITETAAGPALHAWCEQGTGDLILHHPFPNAANTSLRVFATNGQLLHEQVLVQDQGSMQRIALGLRPGVYLLSVHHASSILAARVAVIP
jgi:uncharacterized delta-60 repeat protein